MNSDTKIYVALGVSAATVVGLVVWGSARKSPSSPAVAPSNVVLFPDLKVGDVVLVDSAQALFRSPFAQMVCTVDLVLQDRAVISVRETVPLSPPGERGTIPRAAIIKILATAIK